MSEIDDILFAPIISLVDISFHPRTSLRPGDLRYYWTMETDRAKAWATSRFGASGPLYSNYTPSELIILNDHMSGTDWFDSLKSFTFIEGDSILASV
jgi:hypothetical protein